MSDVSKSMPVSALLEVMRLKLELVAGERGMLHEICVATVQKPGLALAGHLESIHPERVQVIGYSEISYLDGLPEQMARHRVESLCQMDVPCIVVTRGLGIPSCLVDTCQQQDLPLLRTMLSSAELIDELRFVLSARLNPSTTLHGVLVDVFGVGVLILGKSGIGKSEAALDLVLKGHRLVADDIVEIRRRDTYSIYGSGPQIIKHHMEIRGLGVLNIKDLFGIAAVRDTKKVELVVELVEWDEEEEYDRLGVEEQAREIFGVQVSEIKVPVRPGRNVTTIIEVAARNKLLKLQGHHSARDFQERLIRAIAESRAALPLQGDVE